MLVANAIVGLREGLEAALIVVIFVAFLVKSGRRSALPAVWAGVGIAVALSVALGAVLTFGTRELTFQSQEIIGGTTSLIAVAFVTVMVFWMKSAARTMSGELKGKLDRALDLGPVAIASVSFLAVGREGLETAIFFYATAQAAGAGNTLPLLGWAIGIGLSVVLGFAIYRGAVRINLGAFFRWTGVFLVLVAAGILTYGLHDFQEAGVLPGGSAIAVDLSAFYAQDSWYGAILQGIFNISAQKTYLEVVAWVIYIASVLPIFLKAPRRAPALAGDPPRETVASR